MRPSIEVSVVVPVFNEEESLPILHAEIRKALDGMGLGPDRSEVLYVDDRSEDKSLAVMLELRRRDARVRVVRFRRNFGQTAGLAAGFDEARGRVVVTLDGDLQNDPADIPRMVAMLDSGYDVVAGWRKERHDGFVLRRLPSIIANRMISIFTGVRIHDTGCTLKAFRRELIKSMSIYAEQHRFLPVLSAASGARVAEVVVNHRARRFGHSKYGIGRATRVLLDLLTVKLISQFSHRPLHYFGMLSLAALGLAFVFGIVGLFSIGDGLPEGAWTFNDWEMAVSTILMLMISLFVYFALLGLLGELAVKASGMHRRSILDRILNELH
ncbi:MAG: glycosyltransferase family 2 protein [Planctomycetota bacterium]